MLLKVGRRRLHAEDGAPVAGFEPGQYLGIKVSVPGHAYDETRQYSLSNAPGNDHYRIIVKAERTPTAPPEKVSNHLHDARPGTR